MGRYVCVTPCLTPPLLVGLTIPLPLGGAGKLTAGGNLSFNTDCNGCKATTEVLLKLEPALAGIDPFLDLIGCVAAAIKMLKEIPNAILTLDASALLDLLSELLGKCQKYITLGTFPGALVCEFANFTDKTLRLIRAALLCFNGLLTSALTLNINAVILLGDIDPQIRRNGECLATRIQRNLTTLNTRASVLSDLIAALQVIFDLLSIAGLSFTDLQSATAAFSAFLQSQVPGTPEELQTHIQDAVAATTEFEQALKFVTDNVTGPTVVVCQTTGFIPV